MKVYFVRHAETAYNIEKIHQPAEAPLSSCGIKQAHIVGRKFLSLPIETVLSSPNMRAQETARIISDYTKAKIVSLYHLRETRRPSSLIGKKKDSQESRNISELFYKHAPDYKWYFADEENFCDLVARAKRVIRYIQSRKEGSVLVVTHSTFLKLIICVMMYGDSITARDHKLITLLKKSGCVRGYFGFESISSQTLRQTDKRQSVADIEHCIKVMLDYGIDVHGMFVFFGYESPKDISNTVEFARKNGITTAQFLIVTPFPGTPVYETMKQTGALLPLGWEHYTTHEPVFTPAKMSSSELLRRTVLANIRFYGPQYFARHLSNGPNHCGHFYTLMGLYAQYTLWLQLFKNLIKEL